MSAWHGIDASEAESRMRGLSRRLAEIEDPLKLAQRSVANNPTSFAAQLGLRSLEQLQTRLLHERIELIRHRRWEVVDVSLVGDDFSNHSASVALLSVFLIRLQKLLNSIGQAITTGPRLRGPISREISQSTELRLHEIYQSSFGMKFHLKQSYDMFGDSTANYSLQTLFSLLNASRDGSEISRASAELGQRSIGHLRHIISSLATSGSGVALRWMDPAGTEFEWAGRPEELPSIQGNVSRFRTKIIRERSEVGVMVGASLLRDRFELLLNDGSVIDGKIARAAKNSIREFFGSRCVAMLDQVEILDENSGDTKVFYTLVSLAQADLTNAEPLLIR